MEWAVMPAARKNNTPLIKVKDKLMTQTIAESTCTGLLKWQREPRVMSGPLPMPKEKKTC